MLLQLVLLTKDLAAAAGPADPPLYLAKTLLLQVVLLTLLLPGKDLAAAGGPADRPPGRCGDISPAAAHLNTSNHGDVTVVTSVGLKI